jgi:hypothetical protein
MWVSHPVLRSRGNQQQQEAAGQCCRPGGEGRERETRGREGQGGEGRRGRGRGGEEKAQQDTFT